MSRLVFDCPTYLDPSIPFDIENVPKLGSLDELLKNREGREVPEREMQTFTMQLRQITRGRGSFEFEFVRYEQLPANLVSDVILNLQND